MTEKYKSIFEPLTFKNGIRLRNRIVMSPLTNFSSNEDGTVSTPEIQYYKRRATGVGMVITACTYGTENGKGFPGQFSAVSDDMIPSLQQLATTIKEQGAKAILQIFHAGRLAPAELVQNQDVVSASDFYGEESTQRIARGLEVSEIQEIIRGFGEMTRRAIEAGFDGVEIHGANFYLIQQFFSAYTNQRNDQWGGSLERRMSFPSAIIDEVKRIVEKYAKNPFLVGYRFSPEEPFESGITMNDTFYLVDALIEKELDYLHVSLNNFWSKPRRGGKVTQSRIEQIYERVNERTVIIGVGSLLSAKDVLEAKKTGVPLIALGREIIIEPDWIEKVAEGREEEILTTIDLNTQEKLDIPDPLWDRIVNVPDWFPVKR
ncbi:NADH-dependent flavin oxidoreductase [Bacillus thuringiensis serovar yunnanensis]|nr:NADH-dependent flavin oxidoreductase [Bacillus thuringiensis serovar yunnanensis]